MTGFLKGTIREKIVGAGPGCSDYLLVANGILGEEDMRYETAHSEIIEWLVTLGVLGVIAWILTVIGAFLSYFTLPSDHEKEREISALFCLLAAYLGQALLNGPTAVTAIVVGTMAAVFRAYQIPESEFEYI